MVQEARISGNVRGDTCKRRGGLRKAVPVEESWKGDAGEKDEERRTFRPKEERNGEGIPPAGARKKNGRKARRKKANL